MLTGEIRSQISDVFDGDSVTRIVDTIESFEPRLDVAL